MLPIGRKGIIHMKENTSFKGTLIMAEKIRTALKRNVPIVSSQDLETGEKTVHTRVDYPVYALVNDPNAPFFDTEGHVKSQKFNGSESEVDVKRKAAAIELNELFDGIAMQVKLSSGTAISHSTGFYVVPIYAGMTQVRPLGYYKDEDGAAEMWLDKPLFEIPADTFRAEDITSWSDYPNDVFADATIAAGKGYHVEALFKFRMIDDNVAQLDSCVNCLDIVRKVRISIGNSITNNAFHVLGKAAYDKIKAELGEKSYIDACYEDFNTINAARPISKTTGLPVAINARNFKPSALIPSFMFYNWILAYHQQVVAEAKLDRAIDDLVEANPIWIHYLKGIKGCGTKHAAYIIAKLDPTVCRHPSGFLRYLGLDVVYDAEADRMVGRNKMVTRRMPYVNKKDEVSMNNSLGYNTKLKSRIWLLANSMMKAKDPFYYQTYLDAAEYYKNRPDLKRRWEAKERKEDWVKGDMTSPHKMALRKMMNVFVVNLWLAERRIMGLPLNGGAYAEEKLGIRHGYDHIVEGIGVKHFVE